MVQRLTGMSMSPTEGQAIRQADPPRLTAALQASRRDTLAIFDDYVAAGALQVPQRDTLNPPLWELGHIGWFQEAWIARNPQRERGAAADPLLPRLPPRRAGADALYDSSRVPHGSRWQLPLPTVDDTRADLAAQLAQTLALLAQTAGSDEALYFFRLALLHEDMHHEAAVYMARALGVPLSDGRWQPRPDPRPRAELSFDDGGVLLGHAGPGFAFDNELPPHPVPVAAFGIDSRAVSWAEYLPFVEAGGYRQDRWWSDAGRHWRDQAGATGPHAPSLGPVDPDAAACPLSLFEAQAWCVWAGRRLPTEAEWERAALERPDDFVWGEVWEWTASAFAPYPGFVMHPYRDYSAPWFDGRPVLRGGSWATPPRMKHPCYRNFFVPGRVDIIAGFRSCALQEPRP
jgi:iron(II)-dependent oxidoreductase